MSGKQGPLAGACQVTGLFHDSCSEGDGVENRIFVAVHKVSDVWVSPCLERTLQRERRESSAVCIWQGQEADSLASPGELRPNSASKELEVEGWGPNACSVLPCRS